MKQIPNIFTLLNLFFGCLAIVFILQTDTVAVYYIPAEGKEIFMPLTVSPQMWMASLFIIIASIVDVLDGAVARFFNATSQLGKQLDSLSDVVSFGVAPSMILYQFMRMALMSRSGGINIDLAYAFPAFLLACASAYRLAKFNIDSSQTNFFKGVPTPMIGILTASLPMIYWYSPFPKVHECLMNIYYLYALLLILSLSMLINMPMMSLKLKSLKPAENLHLLILVAVSVTSIFLIGWLAVPVFFVSYIVLSLVFKNKFS